MPEMTMTTREHAEQELQVVYHALMMVQRTLGPEAAEASLRARLIGMKQALEATCKLATEDSDEAWTKYRARVLGAARYHYTQNGVDADPQWRKKRSA